MGGEETADERKHRERLEQIEAARRALAARYAADPAGVERFNLRMTRLAQARKRELDRVSALIWGPPRPDAPVLVRPAGMGRADWKIERKRRMAEYQAAVKAWERAKLPPAFAEPTPEQQDRAPYVQIDVTEYRGGRLAKLSRAYSREVHFEKIAGLSVEQRNALRAYRRAFDRAEMSPVKSALDIGAGGGGGAGSDSALQRLELMAFGDIEVRRMEATIPPLLLPVLRAVALHDQDFKAVALSRYGSASGQRRTRVRNDFLRAADALAKPLAPVAKPVVNESPAAAPAPPALVDPAFLDERGLMRPMDQIAEIILQSAASNIGDDGCRT